MQYVKLFPLENDARSKVNTRQNKQRIMRQLTIVTLDLRGRCGPNRPGVERQNGVVEFGGMHQKKGRAKSDRLPYLFKLGFSKV